MSSSKFVSKLGALAIALGCAAFADEPKKEAPSVFESITREVRAVFDGVRGAVCRVEAEDEGGNLAGTGFFIDSIGTFVTTYSIAGEQDDLFVQVGEERQPAHRIVADQRSGIAILRVEIEEPVPFIKAGKGAALEIASPVIVAGYPLELGLSPSFGIVAGFDMGFQGRWFATRHIRANVPVQRGQGGSPVLNLKGEAVGVLISTVQDGSGLFALPIEAAQKILRDFRAHGEVRPGWFGADVRVTGAPEHGSTARIRALRGKGPAFEGKLRPGDVLLQIGDWKITNPEDVLNAAFYLTAGSQIPVRYSRATKIETTLVTPAAPPQGELPVIQRQDPAAPPADGKNVGEAK